MITPSSSDTSTYSSASVKSKIALVVSEMQFVAEVRVRSDTVDL
jgi:hypothetical protein